MEAFRVLAVIFALAVVASASQEHVRKIIHVPYKIHTVHHHQIQKVPVPVPVVKEVPVYNTVEVPVVKQVEVPVIQKVHVPVHVPVQVPVVIYQKPHKEHSFQDSYHNDAWQWQQQGHAQTHEGGHYSGGYW
ncbi:uncharacterized protein LOC132264207 [Phlebotomus argentipes]|uniref:uncharacterized protein LOC132264207 n=1 Tax=Phlebotomus argentipes TaxID=94469 RepID=UPI00289325AB|nr:uncharacterized protein LOC132264207 [Phlebotomus argentipes]